ncbi:MAG: hypothetical protein HY711_01100 [Candidatus Melainabacteria bacterium]|nr:hypothetical protein [Candidatus Melainabacteria bacterium]
MSITLAGMIAITAAVTAILMVGSRQLSMNLVLYSVQTLLVAGLTIVIGIQHQESNLFLIALAVASIKAIGIPRAFLWIVKAIQVRSDPGTILPAPLAMHFGIVLMGASSLLTSGLPVPQGTAKISLEATAALSLLLTGILLMLTRRVALSQILGFLTIENGIYLFALTQTSGMPLIVEMGILLDVLVAVMIAGLLLFRIKSSFEHIDVTQLTGLKD